MASFFQIGTQAEPPHVSAHIRSPELQSLRQEVCPPALFSRSAPAWKRFLKRSWNWLWDLDEPSDPIAPPLTGLAKVKAEFCNALWDLQSTQACQTRDAVNGARSLRELWHLRSDLFNVIAMHRGQAIAKARIETLNNHFPVRMSSRVNEPRHSHTTVW